MWSRGKTSVAFRVPSASQLTFTSKKAQDRQNQEDKLSYKLTEAYLEAHQTWEPHAEARLSLPTKRMLVCRGLHAWSFSIELRAYPGLYPPTVINNRSLPFLVSFDHHPTPRPSLPFRNSLKANDHHELTARHTPLLTLRWLVECLSVAFYCPPVVKPEISGTLQAPEFKTWENRLSTLSCSPRLEGASSPVTWIQGSLEHSGCSNPKWRFQNHWLLMPGDCPVWI